MDPGPVLLLSPAPGKAGAERGQGPPRRPTPAGTAVEDHSAFEPRTVAGAGGKGDGVAEERGTGVGTVRTAG